LHSLDMFRQFFLQFVDPYVEVMTVTHCLRMKSAKYLYLLLLNFAEILYLKEHNRYLEQ